MRGSRNFHERGSNENGNFWSQARGGGVRPPPVRNYPFLGKNFKFQVGSGPPVPHLDPPIRYIVVMHNKRTCNDVYKFLNCTGFLQDFCSAIAESLKLSTVSATFIPFIMYSNCNR